jgi:hypothetical protein
MHLTTAHTTSGEATAARQLLSVDHPMVVAAERLPSLRRQAVAVAVVLAAAALAQVRGAHAVALMLAASLVEAGLLGGLVLAGAAVRRHALELIAEGRGSLPLVAVQRRRARLLEPRHVRALADAVEGVRREAHDPYRAGPTRPLYARSVIRHVDGELAQTACLLRGAQPNLTAVARVELLLASELSVLYGDDATELRQELRRIDVLWGAQDPTAGRVTRDLRAPESAADPDGRDRRW